MNKNLLKAFRFLIYIAEIFLIYIFSKIPGFDLRIEKTSSLLLVPLFVVITVFEQEYASLFFGALIGLFLDLEISGMVGPQTAALCFIGFAVGVLTTYFLNPNFLTTLICGAVLTPLLVIFNYFLKSIFWDFVFSSRNFYNYVFPSVVYTFLLILPAFLFNRPIFYFFSERNGAERIGRLR